MKKKTWGIIMLVLAGMALLGGVANGSLFAMGPIPMVGFLAALGALIYFGIKFVKK